MVIPGPPDAPDVLLFGINSWDSRWQRPQHFVAELVRRGHRVVYVDPYLNSGRGDWQELLDSTLPEGAVIARLGSLSISIINHPESWPPEDVGHAHLTFWRMFDKLSLRCPIMLVQSPAWWPLVGALRSKTDFPLVYDCLDDHAAWNPTLAPTMVPYELELASKADLVLAASHPLYERLKLLARSTLLVPNGCDFEHFARSDGRRSVLRPLLSGPIVGFHGLIFDSGFDAELVVEAARLRPDWNFVLIGPADEPSKRKLQAAPNILLLGLVPYAQLPRYCADYDVAIIPFRSNEITDLVDPVKLYEYLAAGKPVVATATSQLRRFAEVVRTGSDARAFVEAIEASLDEREGVNARQLVAREATWSSRVSLFYNEMRICLPSVDLIVVVPGGRDETLQRVLENAVEMSYPSMTVLALLEDAMGTREWAESSRGEGVGRVLKYPHGLPVNTAISTGVQLGTGDYVLISDELLRMDAASLLGLITSMARSKERSVVRPVRILPAGRSSVLLFRRRDLEGSGGTPKEGAPELVFQDWYSGRLRDMGEKAFEVEDVAVVSQPDPSLITIEPIVLRALRARES